MEASEEVRPEVCRGPFYDKVMAVRDALALLREYEAELESAQSIRDAAWREWQRLDRDLRDYMAGLLQ